MNRTLHITSGDIAGASLAKSGVPGEVFVWHDILYEGPRKPGWPDETTLAARAVFIEHQTGGGICSDRVLAAFRNQYGKLAEAGEYDRIVLWFDACLFDQSMLVHVLAGLRLKGIHKAELLCVDSFPGIEPFHGLGQLRPEQLASLRESSRPVTEPQYQFAIHTDRAFATQDAAMLEELARIGDAPLPHVPAAAKRWLQEWPDRQTGLGLLETLALQAVRNGCQTPAEIIKAVAAADTPPRFWGDTTLWAKINRLADRNPPLVSIEGPTERLPQWEGMADLAEFRIQSKGV